MSATKNNFMCHFENYQNDFSYFLLISEEKKIVSIKINTLFVSKKCYSCFSACLQTFPPPFTYIIFVNIHVIMGNAFKVFRSTLFFLKI